MKQIRFVTACVLICFAAVSVFADSPQTQRPNIIVILSDDMGYSDIGCYGGEINTPNLDRLAEKGLRFTQFYNSARCCPTRASLLTGVYPHQAGIGLMVNDRNLPGYKGDLGSNVCTIAEVLRDRGYRTYMSGKWHVTRHKESNGPKFNWPLQRGFEKFYGTIAGAGSFYDPATLCRGNTFITPLNDSLYQPKIYYYTNAISDNAIEFLKDHRKESPEKPFFMYVAYTAAHWPLHALPEDIEKYRGTYDGGFQPVRKARMEKMKKLGIIDPGWKMADQAEDWEHTKHKEWEIRNMEVYAAMVDCMDRGIGKLVDELKKQGCFENTVIMYLQDNGGCAEGYGRNVPKKPYSTDLKPMASDELQTRIWPPMQTRDGRPVKHGPGVMAGAEDTFIAYGKGWANVSNTPFREYKHFVHEGGIATPFIVSWPDGIREKLNGNLIEEPAHLVDVMSTCVDISGTAFPEKERDNEILPMEGISLSPFFKGKKTSRNDAIYFEHHLNSAVREGNWKLVRKGNTKTGEYSPWELYNMKKDRTEMNNLAEKYPKRVNALSVKWYTWAKRTNVFPSPFKNKKENSN
ncbi:MAG: arylsulfatase [Cytophagales bacterium]|nr:arylsulfatase [Cytophagales bacterium]